MRGALKNGVEKGKFLQTKSSYKLSPEEKKPPPKKKVVCCCCCCCCCRCCCLSFRSFPIVPPSRHPPTHLFPKVVKKKKEAAPKKKKAAPKKKVGAQITEPAWLQSGGRGDYSFASIKTPATHCCSIARPPLRRRLFPRRRRPQKRRRSVSGI